MCKKICGVCKKICVNGICMSEDIVQPISKGNGKMRKSDMPVLNRLYGPLPGDIPVAKEEHFLESLIDLLLSLNLYSLLGE